MSWRLQIAHTTSFRYDNPVVASYNEARVTPAVAPGQELVGHHIEVDPPARIFDYRDYWGSVVHSFDVHEPHSSLTVTSRAVVDTGIEITGPAGASVAWADFSEPSHHDRFYDFLSPSRLVTPSNLSEVASDIRSGASCPAQAAEEATRWAHAQLEYASGSTHVGTSALDAWRLGKGVCQDFAHLALAVLRAMDVPARYVSGYFHPDSKAAVGDLAEGESHAWVEAWTGQWRGYDPTNLIEVGERHVVVAHGRDYSDVAPLRGIYSGPPGSTTEVVVSLLRLA
ncbi:MAG TPA: transglutaminase family protein [Acidimicrobiales bacterium]|nr:transglutaminase family protein [Acidimicrobiales bacterium]